MLADKNGMARYAVFYFLAYVALEVLLRTTEALLVWDTGFYATVAICMTSAILVADRFHKDHDRNFTDMEVVRISVISGLITLVVSIIQPVFVLSFVVGSQAIFHPVDTFLSLFPDLDKSVFLIVFSLLSLFNFVVLFVSYRYVAKRRFDAGVEKGKYGKPA